MEPLFDVLVGAQFPGQLFLLFAPGDGGDTVAEAVSVLQGQVAEPADSLDRHQGPCLGGASLQRGEEMGWFEHGSTIIVLVPPGFSLEEGVQQGAGVRMGQALMQLT